MILRLDLLRPPHLGRFREEYGRDPEEVVMAAKRKEDHCAFARMHLKDSNFAREPGLQKRKKPQAKD